jgi:peptidoglycan/LPS O-acetylase OafA/YrhL
VPAHLSFYLDALRILAAMAVFLGHFSQGWLGGGLFWQTQAHGHTAVIVFFVLSGYVIAYTADTKENALQRYTLARLSRVLSVAVPALIISTVLLLIGPEINPAQYAELDRRGQGHASASLVTQFFAGLFFVSESWGLHIRVLGNTPYWSLAYEVWYYVLFGAAVFLRGRQRLIALAIAALIAGPKILFMAPIWLAGVAAWRWRHTIHTNNAKPLAIGTVLLFAILASEAFNSFSTGLYGAWWPMEFRTTDHIIGFVVALHIAAVAAIAPPMIRVPDPIRRVVKTSAGYSFSIYLFHYPLLVFCAAVLPGKSTDPGRSISLLLTTAVAIYLLAQISEKKRAALKALLQTRFELPRGRGNSS